MFESNVGEALHVEVEDSQGEVKLLRFKVYEEGTKMGQVDINSATTRFVLNSQYLIVLL